MFSFITIYGVTRDPQAFFALETDGSVRNLGTARGYTTVRAGDRYPQHGAFVPGDANSIGFEDLVAIEDYEYLGAVAAGTKHSASFSEAVDYVSVQAALLQSSETGCWEDVVDLRLP